mmetsp:Transcript_5052/g.14885  ORF Transcript_5052/g.14885 Transcript_5052/m.14885 type:complete len:235 (+) Transcript_5052:2376-3080(+)
MRHARPSVRLLALRPWLRVLRAEDPARCLVPLQGHAPAGCLRTLATTRGARSARCLIVALRRAPGPLQLHLQEAPPSHARCLPRVCHHRPRRRHRCCASARRTRAAAARVARPSRRGSPEGSGPPGLAADRGQFPGCSRAPRGPLSRAPALAWGVSRARGLRTCPHLILGARAGQEPLGQSRATRCATRPGRASSRTANLARLESDPRTHRRPRPRRAPPSCPPVVLVQTSPVR